MDLFSLPASQQDSHEPSPTKRRKLDPLPLDATRLASNDDQQLFTLPTVSSDAPAASQVHPPRPAVPNHIALWAVASSLRQSARQLLPLLAKRPSSKSQKSQDRYSRTWASYVQQTAAAIAALRAAVLWTSKTSETKGTRTELRAQAMLAEALIETYEGSGDERKIQGEADSALTRALALASSHPSLSAYTTPLTLLHLRLALAVGKPLKYLKTTLKRALSSLPPPDSPLSRTGANLASSVQLALFGSRLEKEAPNEALAAWRNVKQVAQEVENRQLWVVATLAEARLGLLIEGDIARAASLLAVVHGDLGGDAATTGVGGEVWPTRQLRVMYRLVYCLVHSQLGNVKEAKDMLKATHSLLDAKMDAVEAARPDMIPVEISPSDGVQPTTVTYFQVPPHAELYSFAFVISSIVHYDPMGKQPRAILFAEEGVRIFDGQLCGRDLPPAYRSVAQISTHLREAVGPAIRLRLDLAGLATMRSSYAEAEGHLLSALTILRAYSDDTNKSGFGSPSKTDPTKPRPDWTQEDPTVSRIVLGWAHLRLARERMLAQSGTLAPLNQKQRPYGAENGTESQSNSTSTSSRPGIPPSDGFARPFSTSAMTAGTQLMPNAMPPARTNGKGRESPSYDTQSRQTRASGSAVPPALTRPFGQRQDSSDLPVNPLFGLGEQIRVKEIGSSRLLVQRAGNVVREGYTTRSVTPPDGKGSRNSNKERPRRPDDHDEHWHDRILAKAHEWGLAGALVDGQDDPDRGRTLYLPVPSTSDHPPASKPAEMNGIRHEGYATQVENFKDNEDQQDHFDAARMKLRSLHSEVHELLENAGFRTPNSEKRPEVNSPQLAFVHDDRPVSPAASSLQHQPSFYSASSDIYASASETGHTSYNSHDDTAVIPPRTDSPLSFATLSEGAASTSTYPPRVTAASANGRRPDDSASRGATAGVIAADPGSVAPSTSAAVQVPPAPIPALVVADATPPTSRTLPTRRSSRPPSQSPPRAAGEPYLGTPAVSGATVTSSPPQAYTIAAPAPRRSATADSSALLTTPPVGPDSPQSSPATITSRRFSSTSTSTGRLVVPGMAPRSQSFSPGTPVLPSSQLATPEQAVHTGPGTPPTTSLSYPPVGTVTQPLLLDDVETSIAAQAEMIRRQRQEKRLEAEKEQAKRDRALQLERERAAGAKKERKPSDGSMAAPIEDKLPSGPGALIRRRVSRMGSGSSQPDASGSALHGREASANGRDESMGRRGRGGSGHEGDRAGMGVLVGNLIGQDHANYVLMYNMLTGIRIGVSRCQAKGKRPLTDADYTARHKFSFDIVGNELTPSVKYDFKFKDYAPWVFRELREYFYLDPSDYLISLTAKYILSELGSPGKSGSFFYFSRDYRFIIKTIRHSEHKFLRSILKDYHEHVKKNPHTLLSRFYGLHRVKLPRGKKIHFVIMNNLFPPHRDIHETYDLKGSAIGRLYPEDKAQQNPHATLKDLNWVQRHRQFWLGPEKKVLFEEQLRRDTELLQRLGIMDYSLLTGIHNLFKGNSEGLREDKLTVFQPDAVKVSRKATQVKRDADATALRKAVERSDPQALGGKHELPQTDSSERRLFIFYQDEGGMRATGDHNEELGVIYYLGIIDILTPYTLVKRIEHFFKGMKHNKHMISAVHPREYGDRFLAFIKSSIRGNDESIRPQMYEHEKKRAKPADDEKAAAAAAESSSAAHVAEGPRSQVVKEKAQ